MNQNENLEWRKMKSKTYMQPDKQDQPIGLNMQRLL